MAFRAPSKRKMSSHPPSVEGLGVKSPADLMGERGVGLPNEAAAGTVEAQWAADRGNVPSVQY